MTLPEALRDEVRAALEDLGLTGAIRDTARVSGGCINHGTRLELVSGEQLFLKWNPDAPPDLFACEADGLAALRGTGALRVPEVLAWRAGTDGPSWLLLEFIESRPMDGPVERELGTRLARLHAPVEADFGWHADNWIGSLPQSNGAMDDWGTFWRDRRLAPQLERARARFDLDPLFERVLEMTPDALADVRSAELVHGDLWTGNVFASAEGEAVLIDPAVYRGHGEVDLAMSELFGGFGDAFYDAYDDARSIPDAYTAYRKPLYQLYYLLVHVNLFGASYVSGATHAAMQVVTEFG